MVDVAAPTDRRDDAPLWRALLAMQRHPWEQGVASHAALDGGERALADLLAHDAVVRQDREGRLGATGDSGLVNCGALVEAVGALARDGHQAAMAALERQRRWLLEDCPREPSGLLHHIEGRRQAWVDTVYMAVPALVVLGESAQADLQYRLHRDLLRDPATGLWGHIRDAGTGEWSRSARWASGNGWVAAGLARAARLAAASQARGEDAAPGGGPAGSWQGEAAALIGACAAYERPDGRFHDVLDDPSSFVDGTAGAMLAYAALTGVADGWLDASWAERASRWLAATEARIGEDGLVREVCGSPHFDRPGTSAEAQAMVLLARAAARHADNGTGQFTDG